MSYRGYVAAGESAGSLSFWLYRGELGTVRVAVDEMGICFHATLFSGVAEKQIDAIARLAPERVDNLVRWLRHLGYGEEVK